MKKVVSHLLWLSALLMFATSGAFGAVSVSAPSYKAGDVVSFEGQIEPGQDLYLTISQQKMFAPQDTKGVHEVKKFKKEAKKRGSTHNTI